MAPRFQTKPLYNTTLDHFLDSFLKLIALLLPSTRFLLLYQLQQGSPTARRKKGQVGESRDHFLLIP